VQGGGGRRQTCVSKVLFFPLGPERLGQIVSYADDFVILCASRRQAEESLAQVSRWLSKLGFDDPPDQNAPLLRPGRAVRLSGLHLRSGSALAHREANPRSPALEEGTKEAQGEDQHPAVPGKPDAMARTTGPAQPADRRLGPVL